MQKQSPLLFAASSELLTADQQRVLDAVDAACGALLVVGGPGTGKTTTLLASVIARVRAGAALDKQLIIAGSRSAAQRMRAQLVAGIGRSQLRPNVMTVHGLAQAILRHVGEPGRPPVPLLTAPDQEAAVRELLLHWPVDKWPEQLQMAVPTRGFAAQLRALLARARQLGLDPAELSEIGRAADRPELVTAGEFFAEYLDVLDARDVLDYAELIHRARLAMTEESAWQFGAKFDAIYVDEFAELDRAQVELIADLVRTGPGLVGFADPTTSVFGFRGAQLRAVTDFETRFNDIRPGVAAQIMTLDHQLRGVTCPGYPQLRSVNDAISRRLGARSAANDDVANIDAIKGEASAVDVLISPNDQLAAEQIAIRLRQAHAEGTAWADMAVISRAGQSTLGQLARRLSGFGVPVQVWGDDSALRAEAAVRPLLDGLSAASQLAADGQIEAALAERLLHSPLAGPNALDLRALGRQLRVLAAAQLRTEHESRLADDGWELKVPPANELIAAELSKTNLVPDQVLDEEDAAQHFLVLARLRQLLAELASRLQAGSDPADLLWRVWSGTDWPQRLQSEALSGGDTAQRANRDLDAVIALFDLADRASEFVGQKGLTVLLEQVEAQQIAADTARESDVHDSSVAVLTAHRAKGLEWPLVVVTGLQEGIWPRISVAPQLLAADELTVDGLGEATTSAELIAADRRAFLLAISRASQQLLAVASSGDEGEGNRPSRFCHELGVPIFDAKQVELPAPLPTLDSLVAELRLSAGEVNQPTALRRAAAQELAHLAAAVDAQGRPLVPAADPRRWWGLNDYTAPTQPVATPGQPIRLTGSELENLLACPRSWFLSRKAKADPGGTTAAGLGTIIHTLAQYGLSQQLAIADLRAAVDDIWDQIPFEAAWLSVSERGEVDAALERLQVWSQAAADREVVGVEVPFSVVVDVGDDESGRDQVRLVGAVDRLEVISDESQGGHRLRIVDFKTGRSEPTAAQAAQSDQLGVYQLAAQLGAFNDLVGQQLPLADAQLVYLRSKAKDGVSPKVFVQPSLDERPWLEPGAKQSGSWVHERLTQAARIVRHEQFDAKASARCQFCAFKAGCPAVGRGW